MELSKRLQELVSLAKPGICVADVGCDHGYVSIYLAENHLFEHIIAMDIRTGPLQCAEKNIKKFKLESRIETRLSDGIEKLCDGEADTLICAGMGGELVLHILSQNLPLVVKMNQLILQPQSEIYKVRKFIRENHLKISAESMIKEDGKYYPMMRVEKEVEQDCVMWEEKEGAYTSGTAAGKVCKKSSLDRSGEKGNEDEEKREDEFLRQQVEDEYGPILLQQKNEILKEYLQKELRITKEIIMSLQQLEKAESGIDRRRRRSRELKEKEIKIKLALSYFD